MRVLLILLLCIVSFAVQGQNTRSLQAMRISESVKIDADLDEPTWQLAETTGNFIQKRPNPGKKDTRKSEVKILYDDAALYVGAVMYDVSPDSILRELGKRDDLGNTDFFGIFLDTYNDDINAFGFFITPAGVQLDARYSASNGEDFSWDAVWESAATIRGNTWVAEMRIPFSAIRFPKTQSQVWGLNFTRLRRLTREQSFWSEVDPAISGFVNQYGELKGLQNIKAPIRLSFTPYIAAYAENVPSQTLGSSQTDYQNNYFLNGGMDVKYGISDAFTLDMTLIPDFGQVQSDNQVLNLSPFEVQFNEYRPFFMEGTELFNKGGFFYSRRVGGRPINYFSVQSQLDSGEVIIKNPGESRLLNATKISGRTRQGLGVGVFNAVSAEINATVKDPEGNEREIRTQPTSNYNIFVLDQSLKNNSYISFINTNVMRQGSTYDANLTGTVFRFADKKNKYAISGKAAASQKYFSDNTDLGYMYSVNAGKISGNFQWNAAHTLYSDNYDPNDLGILFTNNSFSEDLTLRYNIYKPFWKVNDLYNSLTVSYSRRFDPNTFQNLAFSYNLNTTFRNFTSVGAWLNASPVKTYDFFEPRVEGRFYQFPTNQEVGGWYSTDYRKKFALDLNGFYRVFQENDRKSYGYTISPRYRVNNQLSFIYNFNTSRDLDELGFARLLSPDSIIFGRRNVKTYTNTLSGSYIFNNRMSLTLRARHYWSQANYKDFYFLQENGQLQLLNHIENRNNVNFNAFNIDMVYSWWFAPGSQVNIVWKNAILDEKRGLDSGFFTDDTYFRNFSNIIAAPQSNSISIKVLYYIDYHTLRQKF